MRVKMKSEKFDLYATSAKIALFTHTKIPWTCFREKNWKEGGCRLPPKDPPNLRELMGGQNLPNYIGTILSLNISNKKSFSGGSIPVLQSIQARKPDLQPTEQPRRLQDQKYPFFALINSFSEIWYPIYGEAATMLIVFIVKGRSSIEKWFQICGKIRVFAGSRQL